MSRGVVEPSRKSFNDTLDGRASRGYSRAPQLAGHRVTVTNQAKDNRRIGVPLCARTRIDQNFIAIRDRGQVLRDVFLAPKSREKRQQLIGYTIPNIRDDLGIDIRGARVGRRDSPPLVKSRRTQKPNSHRQGAVNETWSPRFGTKAIRLDYAGDIHPAIYSERDLAVIREPTSRHFNQ